jgi:hypothetical protein
MYMILNKLPGTPQDFPPPNEWGIITFGLFYIDIYIYIYRFKIMKIIQNSGMPRTGNKPYADFLNGRDEICVTRVVNNGDVVPHVNLARFGTIHHGIFI